jgi:DNA-binding MarR family transcriptional regulator
MATENIAELALDLGRKMSEMRYHLRQQVQVKIKELEHEISFELLEIMALLWRKDGINQQELADLVTKDKSSITYLIDNLAKRNLVTRIEDEKDRRNKLIHLTKEGKQLQKKFHPWIIEIYRQASDGIKSADIEKAILIVSKMNENIRKQYL